MIPDARRLALALGFLAALPACGPGPDCRSSTLNARLVSGTVATFVGDTPPTTSAFTSGGPEWRREDGCLLRSATTVLTPDGAVPAPSPTTLVIRCTIHQAYYGIGLSIPDPRGLAVGSGSGDLRLDAEAYASPECNSTDHLSHRFTYEVTVAEGSAAPSPEFVTSDYERAFNVHFAAQFSTACGPGSVSADLALAETSADLVPNSGCTYE